MLEFSYSHVRCEIQLFHVKFIKYHVPTHTFLILAHISYIWGFSMLRVRHPAGSRSSSTVRESLFSIGSKALLAPRLPLHASASLDFWHQQTRSQRRREHRHMATPSDRGGDAKLEAEAAAAACRCFTRLDQIAPLQILQSERDWRAHRSICTWTKETSKGDFEERDRERKKCVKKDRNCLHWRRFLFCRRQASLPVWQPQSPAGMHRSPCSIPLHAATALAYASIWSRCPVCLLFWLAYARARKKLPARPPRG